MLVRMAIIKKTRSSGCCRKCGGKGTLVHHWWEYKSAQPLWKTVWRFLKKLKIELPDDPPIPLLGIYLKEMQTQCQRESPCSQQHQSQEPNRGDNLNAHQQMNG